MAHPTRAARGAADWPPLNPLVTPSQLHRTPSALDGIPADLEEELRMYGAQLIQHAGVLLGLPQVAMATAQVMFQRFWFVTSLKHFSLKSISMGCLFLACKLEECPLGLRNLVNVFDYLVQRAQHASRHNPSARSLQLRLDVHADHLEALEGAARRARGGARGGGESRGEGEEEGRGDDQSGGAERDAKRARRGSPTSVSPRPRSRPRRATAPPPFRYQPQSYHSSRFHDAKDELVVAEMQLLKRLGFDTNVELPYAVMVNYLQLLGWSEVRMWVRRDGGAEAGEGGEGGAEEARGEEERQAPPVGRGEEVGGGSERSDTSGQAQATSSGEAVSDARGHPTQDGKGDDDDDDDADDELVRRLARRARARLRGKGRGVAQMAWGFLNDSLQTPLPALFPPHVLACASIYLCTLLDPTLPPLPGAAAEAVGGGGGGGADAAKRTGADAGAVDADAVVSEGGGDAATWAWYTLFDVTRAELRTVGAWLLRLYSEEEGEGDGGGTTDESAAAKTTAGGVGRGGLSARVREEQGGMVEFLERERVRRWLELRRAAAAAADKEQEGGR